MNALDIERLAREILATTNPADIDFARFHEWVSCANSYAVSYCPGVLDLLAQANMHVAVLEDNEIQASERDEADGRDFHASPCNTGDYLYE